MKRALQVSLVKKMESTAGPRLDGTPETVMTPEQVNEIVKDQVQNLVFSVGVLLLAKKAADTASELVLIAGRRYI